MAPSTTDQILRLELALDVEQIPIGGTLQCRLSEPQPFAGWLELIAAIETDLIVAREAAPPMQREGDDERA